MVSALNALLLFAAGLALAFFFTRGRARRRSLESHPDTEGHLGRVGRSSRD